MEDVFCKIGLSRQISAIVNGILKGRAKMRRRALLDLFVLLGLAGLINLSGCSRNGNPVNGRGIPPGTMRITFIEEDSMDARVIATLDVDETKNGISMENAAYIDLELVSQKCIGFWATGRFVGVNNNVILLTPRVPAYPGKAFFHANVLYPGNYSAVVPQVGGEVSIRGRFYAFVLDTDDDNTGIMNVVLRQDQQYDTLKVDAAVNTITLDRAACLDSLIIAPGKTFSISARPLSSQANDNVFLLWREEGADIPQTWMLNSTTTVSFGARPKRIVLLSLYAFIPLFPPNISNSSNSVFR